MMMKIGILKRIENTEEENKLYIYAIQKFGGVPILINHNNIEELKNCSGLVLTGGFHKGSLDDFLIDYALVKKMPLLGICQGMQSMALYGTSQELEKVVGHHYMDKYVHSVYLENSNFKNIIKEEKIRVNSYHYETPRKSNYFDVVGRSSDHLIEVVENKNHPFQIGVQWHPERMIDYDENSRRLFQYFIEICNKKNDL